VKLKYQDIKNYLFSPGNIYWDRSEGRRSLISKKGDAINFSLIKKLEEADQLIFIEDSELKLHQEINELFLRYNQSLLMKDKINYRDQIIALLRYEFIENKKSQFELNLIAWNCFSNFTFDEMDSLSFQDTAILNRNLNVASSYVFCAFFIGYYDTDFLKNIFTTTLDGLMKLGENVSSLSLKEKLEYIRSIPSFGPEQSEIIEQMGESAVAVKTMFLERYDGSGMRKLNLREMNDLELLLVSLNQLYSYKFEDQILTNILRDIEIGDLRCEPKTLKMLQRVLYKKPKNMLNVAI
jgi:hypothetical protein